MEGRLKWWPLADIIYSIEYIRTFSFFEELSTADQRILAVTTVQTVTNLTRAYYSVEQRSEVTVNPDGLRHNVKWETVLDLEYDCEVIMGIYRLNVSEGEFALLKAIVCTDCGYLYIKLFKAAIHPLYRIIFVQWASLVPFFTKL
ncbi:hypothetical protein PFISCL1PPCAC_25686 [Pristionchus fissidentatus]|uniref:NR LBD domain-containing protein n=1 Tax=Pristionchus fissidentatus TaxID=1538716 RepID=A0AAV5WXU5_9BILA|nr:hypothetical protein PFISCL1PPCAC_25686 [Pristionchus fissidentatus]